ncbi:Mettl7b protein [Oopsacas minuta]|uniref:Mettl7b protein n=1 Tax=Oopsacas minuta TaxID=111878 RepID=A0AAV7JBJ6_9METZ|nr:Mettl7b protein [Oopsacas minuta]
MKYYLQYSDNIKSLTCIEPNKQFTDVLNSKSTSFPINNYNLRFSEFVASSEKKVDKFDVIILCLVLCSIEDPSEVIDECYKLLVPGGRLLVLEHVIDQESTQAMLMQYLFNPLWKIFGDNCCLTRQPFLHLRTMDWTDISEQMIRVNKNKIPVLRQFYSCVATK